MDVQDDIVKTLLSAVGPPEMDARLYSPVNLAYIGDTVFDLLVRTRLLRAGNRPVKELNKRASGLVCAKAQAAMYRVLEGVLSEEELSVMRRGRNAKTSSCAKNASVIDYRMATGLESLFGYLYLEGKTDRIIELFGILVDNI